MKKWNVLKKYSPDADFVECLLENRGISDKERFLNPPSVVSILKKYPESKKSMYKQAREIIFSAMKDMIPIVIHGDYDADGICATAVLYTAIRKELGYEDCVSFIPNRFEHGYGLSLESINAVSQMVDLKNGGLLVTVDSGVTAVNEVDYANSLGFSVIVTDHHQTPAQLPDAKCIVWDDQVVGASIAWILSKILGSKSQTSLALAATATVTDLQPLLNENRSIVKEGLRILNTNPPAGLKILLAVAGRKYEEATTYDMGWVIGPRLNATGRLSNAGDSLRLLTETDPEVLRHLADTLNSVNTKRQEKTIEMYEMIDYLDRENLPKVIFSANESYHEGIIGLVAARLAQNYYRPAIAISVNGDMAKGSVRSVVGVDIISFLREFEEVFDSVGGHPMAAGFTVAIEKLEELEKIVNETAEKLIDSANLVPSIEVDMEVPIDVLNLSMLEAVEKLQPFGVGNKEPLFVSRNVQLVSVDKVGREAKHLSMKLLGESGTYRGIFFNGSESFPLLDDGTTVDLVYSVRRNSYRGNDSVDLVIKDLRIL